MCWVSLLCLDLGIGFLFLILVIVIICCMVLICCGGSSCFVMWFWLCRVSSFIVIRLCWFFVCSIFDCFFLVIFFLGEGLVVRMVWGFLRISSSSCCSSSCYSSSSCCCRRSLGFFFFFLMISCWLVFGLLIIWCCRVVCLLGCVWCLSIFIWLMWFFFWI